MTQSIESMIEVLQAYKDGKKIEYRIIGSTQWSAIGDPQWHFRGCEYRIAPEPKKFEYLCGDDGFELRWWRKGKGQFPKAWIRVPSEDKEILI